MLKINYKKNKNNVYLMNNNDKDFMLFSYLASLNTDEYEEIDINIYNKIKSIDKYEYSY